MQAQLICSLTTPCSNADGFKALKGLAVAVLLSFIIGGALYSWTSPSIFATAGLLYAKIAFLGGLLSVLLLLINNRKTILTPLSIVLLATFVVHITYCMLVWQSMPTGLISSPSDFFMFLLVRFPHYGLPAAVAAVCTILSSSSHSFTTSRLPNHVRLVLDFANVPAAKMIEARELASEVQTKLRTPSKELIVEFENDEVLELLVLSNEAQSLNELKMQIGSIIERMTLPENCSIRLIDPHDNSTTFSQQI